MLSKSSGRGLERRDEAWNAPCRLPEAPRVPQLSGLPWPHFRYGSLADIGSGIGDVRFTPESGQLSVGRFAMSAKCQKQTWDFLSLEVCSVLRISHEKMSPDCYDDPTSSSSMILCGASPEKQHEKIEEPDPNC